MATSKPRFSITFDEAQLEEITQYQYSLGIATQNAAVRELVRIGLMVQQTDSLTKEHECSLTPMHIGEIIVNYRKSHGLSQREFASKCGGLTNGYISMLENGMNPNTNKPITPSLTKLEMLANGMEIELDLLLSLIGKPCHSIVDDFFISHSDQYSFESLSIARMYDQLDQSGKKLLRSIAEAIVSEHSNK